MSDQYDIGYNDGWDTGSNDGLAYRGYDDSPSKKMTTEYAAGYADGYRNSYDNASLLRVPTFL